MSIKILLSVFHFILMQTLFSGTAPMPEQTHFAEINRIANRLREAYKINTPKSPKGHLIIEGEAMNAGTDGTFRLTISADGKFVRRMETALSETAGFDGETGWAIDWMGMPRMLGAGDLEWEQFFVYIYTGWWLREDNLFATTQVDTGNSPGHLVLKIAHKDSFLQAEVHIDTTSWRVTSVQSNSLRGKDTFILNDYREIAGLMLPGRMNYLVNDIPMAGYKVRSVFAQRPSVTENPFRPALTRPNDVRFNHSISPHLEVQRAATGHFLIRAKVNGKESGWFILDTGASTSVLSRETTAQLQLAPIGAIPLTSMFGHVAAPVHRLDRFEVGPFSLHRPIVIEMDFSPLNDALGLALTGIIGYDLFSRAIVEIAVAENAVAIFDPSRYQRRDNVWQDLRLQHQLPVVRASFAENQQRWFRLDLGAAVTVMFHTPTVRELDLRKNNPTAPTKVGELEMVFGSLPWFELAGHRFEQPNVIFMANENGPGADPFSAGNIGLEFLKPFKLIFDYANLRVAMIKSAK